MNKTLRLAALFTLLAASTAIAQPTEEAGQPTESVPSQSAQPDAMNPVSPTVTLSVEVTGVEADQTPALRVSLQAQRPGVAEATIQEAEVIDGTATFEVPNVDDDRTYHALIRVGEETYRADNPMSVAGPLETKIHVAPASRAKWYVLVIGLALGLALLFWSLRSRAPNTAMATREHFFVIRKEAPKWQRILLGLVCMGAVYFLWWWVTRQAIPEERTFSPTQLASPTETFSTFKSLWYDRALTRNTMATLRRVFLGFSLAVAIGIPLGVLAGCFSRVKGFLTPLMVFGRNAPIAALIPLTFSIFGIGELQKIMFICLACVAFVISDTAQAIEDVQLRYIDTAYTLGANRRQVILKVLVPLAMPNVFNALRVLFGLAFGYIMLAELVKFGDSSGGLGDIINLSQRRGPREHVLLVLLIIPVVALFIDRMIFAVQRQLFPHVYGGAGTLNWAVRGVGAGWENSIDWMLGKFQRSDSSQPDAEKPARDESRDSKPKPDPDPESEPKRSADVVLADHDVPKTGADMEAEVPKGEAEEPDPRSEEGKELALEDLKRRLADTSGDSDE